jgi:hypothetical protein
LIGSLNINYQNYINNVSNKNFTERLKTLKYNHKFIGLSPNSLLTFENDENLLILAYNDKLELYDSNINLIKTITSINNKKINCCKAITTNKNLIYMCEHNSHKLKVIDYKFNELLLNFVDLKSTIKKSVQQQQQLYYPYDLCYHNGFIYVCDLRNRIVKLDENLDYVLDYQLNFQIRQILVTNNCLCLNTIDFNKIYFLNIDNFEIIKFYESFGGPICELDSFIYEFSGKYGEFISCYDFNGCFIEKFKTKFISKHITFNNNVCIKRFLDKIILTSSCGKLLII